MVKTRLQNRSPVKKRESSSEKKKVLGVKMAKKSICKSEKKRHGKRDSGGVAGKKKRVSEGVGIDFNRRKKKVKTDIDEGSGVKVATSKVFIDFLFLLFFIFGLGFVAF